MEKKKQNINPAVVGGVAAGAAVAGAAGTAAARSFMDRHPDMVQSLHTGGPSLPAEVTDEPDEPAEAVIVDDGAADGDVRHQPHSDDGEPAVTHEQHISAYGDELVAVEAVDPHDVEDADVAEYGEVGVIVSDAGVEQNYAVVEVGDEQLAMVDLDGDGVFDVMADEHGNAVLDLSGPDKPAFTVSDAELQLQEQNGQYEYMAQTELDNNSDTSLSGDCYADDVIEV